MLDQVELKTLAIELAATLPPPPPSPLGLSADQSPRSRAMRRIAEIVASRGWQIEVSRALDRYGVAFAEDLPDAAVFALRDRLDYYEDCVQFCCDPDDAPPAR